MSNESGSSSSGSSADTSDAHDRALHGRPLHDGTGRTRGTRERPSIEYWTAGSSGPRVLLLMGFGMRGELWRPQIEGLRATHQLAWLDNRGVGASERGASALWTTRDMALDALGVLDALGWSSAHVVGVSMGGMIAQEVALAAPERTDSLALIATFGGGSFFAKLPRRTGLTAFVRANLARSREARFAAIEHLLYPDAFLRTVDRGAMHARMQAQFAKPVAPAVLNGQLHAVRTHQALDRLRGLPTRTLVFKPRLDVLVRPSHSDVLARTLPGARLVELDDAGHGLIFQSAPQINALLAEHFAG